MSSTTNEPTTPPPGDPEQSADRRLGTVVRARRHALGRTLVEVAGSSGLSHSFLSQLERGRARPSMRSLYLIAQALGTTQQALLAAATPPSTSPVGPGVVSGQSPALTVQAGSARLLSHVEGGADVTEFLNVPETFEGYFAHGRHELVYVVSGRLEVELAAPDPHEGSYGAAGTALDASPEAARTTTLYTLEARQSIGYPGSVRHRHRRVGTDECVVLVVHSGPEDAGDTDHEHGSASADPDT
ncbi:predicted transcriptional regulator [Sanguibacter keddieii DSM 10542]|uniref:Predicted transcriptional regulator n=1 Tax=Sanguibacter keddieii (strain ATCC 51767 / DSM 10542 / NCFB 3025 / ST-74) TaxID=446469 RepID=D1BGS4_SANKS|nr:XRE family transcriptional regulator [Sanguibacter keddieii]ACZ21651.1 predicted transcriptional regulator [Sanguibacter keddieii DSM 10542]